MDGWLHVEDRLDLLTPVDRQHGILTTGNVQVDKERQTDILRCMYGWMDGWINGWMDGWMDGWIDGWMDGWMDGSMDGWMDQWMECHHFLCIANWN